MQPIICTTDNITPLTEQIHRVRIKPIKQQTFEFKGGQYLFLLMPDGKRVPLSIASPPEQKNYIELHIRLIPGHDLAAEMLDVFSRNNEFTIEGPCGDCFLQSGDNDVVIIAGGTGFSPMSSLLQSALSCPQDNRQYHLFLGAQTSAEIYQTQLIKQWQFPAEKFNYVPVINQQEAEWQGEFGFPHQAALKLINGNASKHDFYISGSGPMVMSVYQALLDAGADKTRIYSDMLDIKRSMGEDI
jgi:CDP-4-dehydro-6-deoxyglucose reductase, E3